ncbi:MAG TPA: BadF/BadG/BcrA/BcrD ATPase family protein [Fimbriimonadaceae bacterium]|nr:BadF/BadG/BcrA/BcrD ATPase family protein [Fimbriimonadaceae bacterium]
MTPVFVGLDCGGSTSRALAVDMTGAPIFHGQSGAANLATTREPMLRRHLARATEGCPSASAVCGCFAGLMTENDRQRAKALLGELFPGASVRAEPDYAAAFASAEQGIDVCVIAGTGSLVCSSNNGGWVKSGGGGYLLGDYGSAFDFGRHVLQHYVFDGETPTPFTVKLIEQTFETKEINEVISRLYASPAPPAVLAKLATALTKDADAGETYALEAIDKAMQSLARLTVRHIHRHVKSTGTVRIGLAGGVWKTSASVLNVFTSSIRDQLDRSFEVERLNRPPVYGATALAKELTLGN